MVIAGNRKIKQPQAPPAFSGVPGAVEIMVKYARRMGAADPLSADYAYRFTVSGINLFASCFLVSTYFKEIFALFHFCKGFLYLLTGF